MKLRFSGLVADLPPASQTPDGEAYYYATDEEKVYEDVGVWVERVGPPTAESAAGLAAGLIAGRAAAGAAAGWLYYATDEEKYYESFPGVWVEYNPADVVLSEGGGAYYHIAELTDEAEIAWGTALAAKVTLGGDRELGLPVFRAGAGVDGATAVLEVVQDATGGRVLTYAAGITWPGGTVPDLSEGAGAVDVITLMTFDRGVSWRGALQGGFA